MYLHKDHALFKDVITRISKENNSNPDFIEKDYYITVILKSLLAKCPAIVFKGGTSLSKCFGVINRFSEDIDISFKEHIGESKRNRLKNKIIKSISDELELPIINWDVLHSNNNVNKYIFEYQSVIESVVDISQNINLEISLVLPAYPYINYTLDNYINKYFNQHNNDFNDNNMMNKYNLSPFNINCQALERTFIDKVFAICDYYLLNKSARLSRHLYDLHKLFTHINIEEVTTLLPDVHKLRSKIELCPSAKPNVDIKKVLNDIINSDYYKKDYKNVTSLLIYDNASYNDCVDTLKEISEIITFPIL